MAKIKFSFRAKISASITIAVVLTITAVALVTTLFFNKYLEDRQADAVKTAVHTTQEVINNAKSSGLLVANQLKNSPELKLALYLNDRNRLVKAFKQNYQLALYDVKADAMYVTDSKNKVFLRLHNPAKFGDDKGTVPVFDQALKTKQPVTDWAIGATGIEVLGAVPVTLENQVLGVLAVGQHANQDMAEEIAKTTSTDVTLYWNTTKVAEADYKQLEDSSNKSVQTTETGEDLKDKEIIDTVLTQGKELVREEEHEGITHSVAYIPLKDNSGKAIGMVSLKVSKATVIDTKKIVVQMLTVIGVILTIIGILYGLFISSRMVKPVNAVSNQLQAIANGGGDLTKRIEVASNDEIGLLAQAFNKMVENLSGLIKQIADNAVEVARHAQQLNQSAEQSTKAAEQIASTVTEVSTGTEKQVSGTKEASEVINQISEGIQQIVQSAQSVAATSVQASSFAESGNSALSKATNQMSNISNTVNESSGIVADLGQRSTEIGQIVDIITSIAGQTNLLALNAAIEAARAGEQGRGFAVVAEEVRKLAEQSAGAAKQISELIGEIQVKTAQAVEAMEAGTKEVAEGTIIMGEAGEAFGKILNAVNSVSEQIGEVSAATQQMAAGSTQVVRSIQDVAAIAETSATGTLSVASAIQEQTATMEEIAASAHVLSEMSVQLQELVGNFKL